MRLLERWLEDFPPAQRILDLGCGPGSLPAQLAGMNVIGVDFDPKSLGKNFPAACADSHRLPFAGAVSTWLYAITAWNISTMFPAPSARSAVCCELKAGCLSPSRTGGVSATGCTVFCCAAGDIFSGSLSRASSAKSNPARG